LEERKWGSNGEEKKGTLKHFFRMYCVAFEIHKVEVLLSHWTQQIAAKR
jgi:hypothetical protein